MSELDHIMGLCSGIDGHTCQWDEDDTGEQLKEKIKTVMLDTFKHCEHDGSFVSVSAFKKGVAEL